MGAGCDLTWYFRAVCLPAVAITAAALFYLHRQEARDRVRARELQISRIERLAADFQDSLREISPANDAARILAVQTWKGPPGVRPVRGRFAWQLHRGLVWEESLPRELADVLNAYTRWNEWTALGKKNAKRGLQTVRADCQLLWARVGAMSYGLVFDGPPFEPSAALPNWPLGVILVGLLVGVLLPGGWLLAQAAKRAREDDARKTTFVSNVSHELKTPLAAIGLWAELLARGRVKTDEKRRRAYSIIVDENARMARLVENLLDFTRLEQGRRVYRPQPVDLVRLAQDAVELVRTELPKGVAVSGVSACTVETDPDAVKQILVNLLGNAAKYASEGGPVDVAVERHAAGCTIAVADRGPGIAAADRERIFERFFRANAVLENTAPGLGLGLSISRALARDLKGELSVAARAGGGAVFTLALPG
ncbi:MAG: sensor histidine kinase [Kiritimatiellia bacterium]